jgi:CBS domain-containing protein
MIVRTILNAKADGNVATTTADQLVVDAAQVLHRRHIGALIVVNDQDDGIVGIFSERDIARGVALQGENIRSLRVRDLMTSAVLVCSPNDSLHQLEEVMTLNRVRHLPVLENGKLIGIITIGDVVKSCLEDANLQVDSLRTYVMEAR